MLSSACATTTSNSVVCPELVRYTPGFQTQAADEAEMLPEGSALVTLIEDYLHLRDRIRAACPAGD
jgi:hypothetical protein